ncbi:Aldehyde oxidase glox1 [Thalictrum thalictroides]|uniref:Aldehyde oxidase GLOX n=1 Tax=Thalictrum thalictroides TaxID=46969 RepID=A0A7J6WXD1_THATH|nr:Aldehyde oxidase glox1 [Thalictrum thalictroides]
MKSSCSTTSSTNFIHSAFFIILWFWFSIIFLAGQKNSQIHAAGGGGQWVVLQKNIGITAMHMQLLNNDRVVIFDRTDFGESNITLPDGKCRNDTFELAIKNDCTAHSVEYDVISNSIRPLMVQTDVWCSSGVVAPDGHLIQTGGFNDGERVVRTFEPCGNCDWIERGLGLVNRRWYATNHILPDGRAIIIGGRRQFNYEFYPKSSATSSAFTLPLLRETNDPNEENNLYPFVHLNVDGNLFIYANNRSILLDYKNNIVVRSYPPMPGGHPRNYPSTGSSVLLPLRNLGQPSIEAEVLICGGAPRGSYAQVVAKNFIRGLDSCGRIKITDKSPRWIMETMPLPRVMGDMILLPNGHVLIINGVEAGTAGWEDGRNPVLNPVIYRPNNPFGKRFETQNPSSIPRVYHSTAILLRDGRILVGGSNPHMLYNFTGVLYPTELRLEAFSPTYLDSISSNIRPKIISPAPKVRLTYGQRSIIRFSIPAGALLVETGISITMVSPSFTTHSFAMNQRLLVLSRGKATVVAGTSSTYQVQVTMPNSVVLAPPGYYLLFVNHQEIPSEGMWVQIQ